VIDVRELQILDAGAHAAAGLCCTASSANRIKNVALYLKFFDHRQAASQQKDLG
jgi:hypothetical protein